MKSISEIQAELHNTKSVLFKNRPAATYSTTSRALTVNEEAGELARQERLSIDGFPFNEEKARDAVGDTMISLLGYCISRKWDAQSIIETTFEELKERWASGEYSGEKGFNVEPEAE